MNIDFTWTAVAEEAIAVAAVFVVLWVGRLVERLVASVRGLRG